MALNSTKCDVCNENLPKNLLGCLVIDLHPTRRLLVDELDVKACEVRTTKYETSTCHVVVHASCARRYGKG